MTERLRTLVVDDDVAVAQIHGEFVNAHPNLVAVGVAHSGAEALTEIVRLRPEVVLLDVYLPDFSGLELLDRLRAWPSPPRVEFVVVTAARDLSSVRDARALGVRYYLVKPFTAATLRARLDEVVRHGLAARRPAAPGPLDQASVDAVIAGAAPGHQVPVKGLAAPTLEAVVVALHRAAGDLSASEVGERIGVSRVVARRYLEHLVSVGHAQVTPRYGRSGRPENRYRRAR